MRECKGENETIHDTVSLRDLLTELSPQSVAVPGWTCVRGAAGYFAGLRKRVSESGAHA